MTIHTLMEKVEVYFIYFSVSITLSGILKRLTQF